MNAPTCRLGPNPNPARQPPVLRNAVSPARSLGHHFEGVDIVLTVITVIACYSIANFVLHSWRLRSNTKNCLFLDPPLASSSESGTPGLLAASARSRDAEHPRDVLIVAAQSAKQKRCQPLIKSRGEPGQTRLQRQGCGPWCLSTLAPAIGPLCSIGSTPHYRKCLCDSAGLYWPTSWSEEKEVCPLSLIASLMQVS